MKRTTKKVADLIDNGAEGFVMCSMWGGFKGRNEGQFCGEPEGHSGDHSSYSAGGNHRWPNDLDKKTRLQSIRDMAAWLGHTVAEIDAAETAGRHAARANISSWVRGRPEALGMVASEAAHEERRT